MRHVYCVGATGTGKSTLLENLIIQDMEAGRGVCVIDPHGDLAEKILHCVPKRRTNEVVYFDPSDTRFPIGFNPIEPVPDDQKHIVVSGMMSVFEKLFFNGSNFASQAPQLTHILRNALYAVMDFEPSTLMSIKNMLLYDDFRRKVVASIKDPEIKKFWEQEFVERILKRRDDPLASTLNKLGQFLSIPMLRNIISQHRSNFDLKDVMDNGKILIVNLSKGKIGEDSSAMLGAMIITKLYLSSMNRVYIPESERKDFFLYVDEFQNFSTDSFASILSESRKYRLGLTMANQYLKQLSEPIRDAVFGNCGTVINFRCGADDAEFLEKYYAKEFTIKDIVSLPKFSIYLRLMINGTISEPFSATTLPPHKSGESNALNIIKQSRLRYSKKLSA